MKGKATHVFVSFFKNLPIAVVENAFYTLIREVH